MTMEYPFGGRPPIERLYPWVDPILKHLGFAVGLGSWRERDLHRLRIANIGFGALVWTGGIGTAIAMLLALQPAGGPMPSLALLALRATAVFTLCFAAIIVATATALRTHQRIETVLAVRGTPYAKLHRLLLEEEGCASKAWEGSGRRAVFRISTPSLEAAVEGDPRHHPHRIRLIRVPGGPYGEWIAKRACCEPWRENPHVDLGPLRDLHALADAIVAIAERTRSPRLRKAIDYSVN